MADKNINIPEINIPEIPNNEVKGFLEPYEEELEEINDILKEDFPELFE